MPDAQLRDPRMRWPEGHDPASALVFAHNEVEVGASPEEVWRHLIGCTRWPRRYERRSDVSILEGGSVLRARSRFRFETRGRSFEPVVRVFEPAGMVARSAKGPAGTSGAHAWRIERTATWCRVIPEETQRGLLLRLVAKRVRGQLLAMHENWLQSLKRLAETGDRAGTGHRS